jgi:hypothetical protein
VTELQCATVVTESDSNYFGFFLVNYQREANLPYGLLPSLVQLICSQVLCLFSLVGATTDEYHWREWLILLDTKNSTVNNFTGFM